MRLVLLLVLVARIAFAQSSPELTKEFQAGVDAYRLGHFDDAKKHLERARQIDPKLPGPYRFLAAVAQAQGQWADCIADARKALLLNPQSSEASDTRKLHDECRASAGKPPFKGELGDSAALAVTTSVPGATVKVGGITIGGTPMAPRPITAGKLEVEVTKVGWKPAKVDVDAPAGIVTDVELELEPDPNAKGSELEVKTIEKPTKGVLIVKAPEVSIDGKPPTEELEPGTHLVEARAPEKDVWRRRVRVVAGQRAELHPAFIDTHEREQRERIGFAVLAGAGALVVTGFIFARESEDAANTAREIQRVESARDASLAGNTALEPLHTRADFDAERQRADRDALYSDLAYGAALAAGGVAAYYLYKGARERTDVPPPFAIAPAHGGALIAKELRW